MVKRIIFLFLLLILSLNFMSSLESLGEFEPNTNVTISQTCYDATYINITSIQFPNGTRITINEEMEKDGDFFYSFSQTSQRGRYDVRGISDGCSESFAYYFYIGKRLQTGESLMYIIMICVLSLFWLFLLYLIIILPSENNKNENGNVIGIVKLKYLRIFVMGIFYVSTIILLNMLNGLAINYTDLSMFANIIGFLFTTMINVSWIFTVILAIWLFYMLIHDSNVEKQLSKISRFRING